MVPANYVQSLVQYAEVRGAKGLQTLLDFHDELFDRVRAEEGSSVVNTSVNGKAFGFQVNMTVEEQFGAVGEAIRELDPTDPVSGRVRNTRADFRNLILRPIPLRRRLVASLATTPRWIRPRGPASISS
jgi:hypothetical protein